MLSLGIHISRTSSLYIAFTIFFAKVKPGGMGFPQPRQSLPGGVRAVMVLGSEEVKNT